MKYVFSIIMALLLSLTIACASSPLPSDSRSDLEGYPVIVVLYDGANWNGVVQDLQNEYHIALGGSYETSYDPRIKVVYDALSLTVTGEWQSVAPHRFVDILKKDPRIHIAAVDIVVEID